MASKKVLIVSDTPLQGAAAEVLNKALGRAGLRHSDLTITSLGGSFAQLSDQALSRGVHELHHLVSDLRPNIVVTLGDQAAWTFLADEGWPGADGRSATGIGDRRGFFWWSGRFGVKVITTLHPATLLSGGAVRGLNASLQEFLLAADLTRAAQESSTPDDCLRKPIVLPVTSNLEADLAIADLCRAEIIACDIEIRDNQRLACVGFAGSLDRSYVFTERAFSRALEFLGSRKTVYAGSLGPGFVFQNGSFDSYFLRERCGLRDIPKYQEDTIVQWHTLFIEFAGAAASRSKRTAKSLNFLASLYSKLRFWKDYNFANDAEMYELCGIDCSATLEIHGSLKEEHKRWQIDPAIYRHEMSLIPVVTDILGRGIKINEGRRLAALGELEKRATDVHAALAASAIPALEIARPQLSAPHLFWTVSVCRCCRGGASKSAACWSCAGFEKAPSKKALAGRILEACTACAGAGRGESFSFNPRSDAQKKILLFEALKVPKRYKDGALCTDEAKLKSLLPILKEQQRQIVTLMLTTAKLETMRRLYERLAPGPDGRLRTSLSPVGTDTGRLSSSETFLEVSTNLQNLPKKTAKLEPLYDARRCMVPSEGMVFVEADYSQIEARLTSGFARDLPTLDAFASGADVHKRTAAGIFGVAESAVTPEQRILGKFARHALNYGMGWQKFMEEINTDSDLTGVTITAAKAKEICDGYRRLSPALVRWWGEVFQTVQREGVLVTPFGRKRIFFDRSEAIRNAAIAFLPQSTAADLVNRAIVRCRSAGLVVLLQIHDAILIEAPKATWREAAAKLKAIMTAETIRIGGIDLAIPVDVSASSDSWGEMKAVHGL